jgi:hypothetical protein
MRAAETVAEAVAIRRTSAVNVKSLRTIECGALQDRNIERMFVPMIGALDDN